MDLVGVAVGGGKREGLYSGMLCGCCRMSLRLGHNGCGLGFCLVCLCDASLGEPERLGEQQHVRARRETVLCTCSFPHSDWNKNARINLSLVRNVKSRGLWAWAGRLCTHLVKG